MVKLKSSFDKIWGDINEIVTTVMNEILWGKLAQEKCELLSQIMLTVVYAAICFYAECHGYSHAENR